MNSQASIALAQAGVALDPDSATNRAIREVASTPSAEHVIPAEVVALLYGHLDHMRAEFFGGQLPEIVLSFDVADRRILGTYHIRRSGVGVRWLVNLNLVHLARPLYQVLGTLLHEAVHAWQHGWGAPSRPPHHNAEFRDRCNGFGILTDERGHDLGVRQGSPFEDYCRRHGVAFPSASEDDPRAPPARPPPLLPAPPAKPKGSKLRKWTCACGINVRVAVQRFDATCNACGERFRAAT